MQLRRKCLVFLFAAACGAALPACDQRTAAVSNKDNDSASQTADSSFGFGCAQHVLVISIDGLRPDALQSPWIEQLPEFAQLLNGPHTLGARCDPDVSVTLPNHVGMATGRLLSGANGHGWLPNILPPIPAEGETLHETHDRYTASMFDVAHDAGCLTGLFAMKSKFILFDRSYDELVGAPSLGRRDAGRDKIDAVEFALESEGIARRTIRFLREASESRVSSLAFLHFSNPDIAGHGDVWELKTNSPYFESIQVVDCALGEILTNIEADPALRSHVAIVLTADHGGGNPSYSHTVHTDPINFTIPFLIWGAWLPACDLYDIAATSRHLPPRSERFSPGQAPPIRNADAGNTALLLLGLPPIPGSTVNARQDLLNTRGVPSQ